MTEIHRLEQKVDAISKEQAEQGHTLVLIKNAVGGDKLGNKGVIPTQIDHGVRITKLEENEKKRKWFLLGLSTGGGFIGGTLGGTVVKATVAKMTSGMPSIVMFFLKNIF